MLGLGESHPWTSPSRKPPSNVWAAAEVLLPRLPFHLPLNLSRPDSRDPGAPLLGPWVLPSPHGSPPGFCGYCLPQRPQGRRGVSQSTPVCTLISQGDVQPAPWRQGRLSRSGRGVTMVPNTKVGKVSCHTCCVSAEPYLMKNGS